MITFELLFILTMGTTLMCALIMLQMKWYSIQVWKAFPFALALVFTGVMASKIWFFIENWSWGGRSLYGAIAFSPLVFLLVAKLLRIKYLEALDFVAPGGCLTLALVKIQCLMDHCCEGMVLYIDENRIFVKFPSQTVEMVVFLILSVILVYMSYKQNFRNKIFPWFLFLYGITRFVLNSFRAELEIYALGMSAGHFWSLIALIIGAVWLILIAKKKEQKT